MGTRLPLNEVVGRVSRARVEFTVKHLLAIVAFSCPVISAADAPAAESFIEARGPAGPLKGTMLSPAVEQGPVMLIIPGSGPTDDAKALKLAGFISA